MNISEVERTVRQNELAIADLRERLLIHQHYLPDKGHILPFSLDGDREIKSVDTLRDYLLELMDKLDALKQENSKLQRENNFLQRKMGELCNDMSKFCNDVGEGR